MKNSIIKYYHKLIPIELRMRFYKIRNPREYEELRSNVFPSPKGDFSLKAYDENKTIFVHITKTAGTSVAKSLFGYLPYHYTSIDYRVIYGKKAFNNYFKFAFVRNPWDRLYSAYRYLKSGGWNDEDKKWSEANLSRYNDFNHFILDWLTPQNITKHIHFKPQYEFICDTKENILIDYIAYFETINEDFNYIAEQLNLDVALGTHNANPGESYKTIYSKEAIEKVRSIYKKDIELFGYNFEGIESRLRLHKKANNPPFYKWYS